MDINQLKYFISVAQTLNFSEAARRNGISQPAISHHIGELEKQLGCQLFLRSRRSVTVTEQGLEFLPYAMQIVETAEKAAFQLSQREQGVGGHVTIAALTTSSQALSRCLARFAERYPEISVDISFTSGRSQVLAMNEERFDFHFAVREMVPNGATFDSVVSNTDHLCVAFPASHPLAHEPLDFAKLKEERFVAVSESDGPALYNEVMKACRMRGYTPNICYKFDRAEAVLLAVGAGMGISIIPEAISKVFYSENVVFHRIEGEDALRTYVVAWRRELLNPAARLFLETVREVLELE